MTQLHELVRSIRHKVQDTIQLIRSRTNDLGSTLDGEQGGDSDESYSKLHRLRRRAVQSLGSSCSPEAAAPDEGTGAAKVVDSVIGTLFGDCYGGGGNCSDPVSQFDDKELMKKMQKRQRFTSKPNKRRDKTGEAGDKSTLKTQGLPIRTINPASSRDECHYAQYYNDDHAEAAKAVIQAREREERERGIYRKRMENMKADAIKYQSKRHLVSKEGLVSVAEEKDMVDDADPGVMQPRNNTYSSPNRPQHRENIKVGDSPYRLYEVANSLPSQPGDDEHEHDAISCNYDDGISALSAHTLEEMTKTSTYLYRRNRSIPKEEGFDIVARSNSSSPIPQDNDGTVGPPSPVETDGSSSLDVDRKQANEQVASDESDDESDYGELVRSLAYPVQIDQNSSLDTTMNNSSQSSDSELCKKEEKQYWTQVVAEEQVPSGLNESRATEKRKNNTSKRSERASPTTKRKSRRPRSMNIFNRRSGYVECEEDGY